MRPTARSPDQALELVFGAEHPLIDKFGIETASLSAGDCLLRMPYLDFMIGNPETGVLHGGVVTTLIDTACGMAVFSATRDLKPVATLDLRIDYMKPSTPKRPLFAHATVGRMTTNIGFVRAAAYHDNEKDPIATAAASFMLGTRLSYDPNRGTAAKRPQTTARAATGVREGLHETAGRDRARQGQK